LRHYDNLSFLESKISTLEKSVYEINHTEIKLVEVVKNVESQLEKHQKAITSMLNDCKAAQASDTTSPVPSITEESVATIASSITAEQKEKVRRQLNVIVHNIAESNASEGSTRKEDIGKCKCLFQTYLGMSVTIQNAICLGKRSDKPRLLKVTLNSVQDKVTILKNKFKLHSSNNLAPV